MHGQAKGVRDNYRTNKDIYDRNAEYGEESKQQSTNAKIATQGGTAAAVATDVTDASIKALQQMGSTKGMMGVANNIEGQQEFVNKTLAGARDAEHRNQMLKDFENSGWTDANGIVKEGAFIKARAMLGANNMMASNSMGIGGSVVSGTIGATSDNTTVKVDGVDSSASGKTTTLNNDVITLNNTDAKTRNQLENTNGNKQEAANRLSTRDRLDYESSPKNQVLDASTDLIHKLTPQEQQENAAAIAGTMAAGVAGTYAAYKLDDKLNDGKLYGSVRDKLSGKNPESDKQAMNSSNNNQPNEPHNSDSNNRTHGNSFNSDMQDYTQNKQNLQEEFKDIGKQKQDLTAKYNGGKMSKEDYTSKFNSLDAKQMSLTNDLDDMDRYIKAEETKAETENTKKTINRMPESQDVDAKKADTGSKGSGSKAGWLSALAMPLVNEAADFLGIDKSQSLALSSIEAGSEILDGGFSALIDTAKAGLIGGAKAIRGDSDAGQYFSKNISSAASNLMGGFEQANDTMATYAVMQEFNRQQAAPQHQNFTTQPSGYNTYQAMQEQHQAVTASNVGTLATIVESRSGGLILQDANTNPVSFTTSKAEGHNVMMNRRPKICATKKETALNYKLREQFISKCAFTRIEFFTLKVSLINS